MIKLKTSEVIDLAKHLHRNHRYGNKPYTYHLDQVYKSYLYLFGNVNDFITQIVYLHDTIEDCNVTGMDLELQGVSPSVVTVVEILTKFKDEPTSDYIDRVMECEVARKVKAADSFSNLQHSFISGNGRLIEKYTKNLKTLMREA